MSKDGKPRFTVNISFRFNRNSVVTALAYRLSRYGDADKTSLRKFCQEMAREYNYWRYGVDDEGIHDIMVRADQLVTKWWEHHFKAEEEFYKQRKGKDKA